VTPSGSFTSIAGTGVAGYSGDGGAATSAQLNKPYGLAVDTSGNIYIADSDNARIRKISAATGTISTVVGTGINGYSGDGGPATSAKISSVKGVAVDAAGNLYIPEYGYGKLRKVAAATGVITTIVGTNIDGDGAPSNA
jgi:DNA-binding beta-propeller fold protein YncE